VEANNVMKGLNCQDWAEDFIRYLVLQGAIDASALEYISGAPRS
jgi:hypothetical protein